MRCGTCVVCLGLVVGTCLVGEHADQKHTHVESLNHVATFANPPAVASNSSTSTVVSLGTAELTWTGFAPTLLVYRLS